MPAQQGIEGLLFAIVGETVEQVRVWQVIKGTAKDIAEPEGGELVRGEPVSCSLLAGFKMILPEVPPRVHDFRKACSTA